MSNAPAEFHLNHCVIRHADDGGIEIVERDYSSGSESITRLHVSDFANVIRMIPVLASSQTTHRRIGQKELV